MTKHKTQGTDHPMTTVELEPGQTVALCRCFASSKFPFCDGTHKQHQGKGPAIVKVAADSSQEK